MTNETPNLRTVSLFKILRPLNDAGTVRAVEWCWAESYRHALRMVATKAGWRHLRAFGPDGRRVY